MRFFVALLVLLPALLPAAACGGSDAQCVIDTDCPLFNRCMAQQCVPLGGGDPDSGIADSGVMMDSSTMDSSTPDAGSDSGTPELGRGAVQLVQTPNPVMATHTMSATFTATGGTEGCTITDLSPCVMTECIFAPPPVSDGGTPDAGMVDAGPPSFPSAGVITTTGGAVDVSVTPEADGNYPITSGVGLVFNGGETLTMTAAGDAVPAFSGNVPAPYAITVSAPSFMSPPLSIDRTMDFTVTWTSVEAEPGVVTVVLNGSGPYMVTGARTVSLLCTFPGADGTGTILASHLANLPTSILGGPDGSLAIATSNLQRITASGWTVDLTASLIATSDTGNPTLAPTRYP
ncbi:MAG: hypothetical protein JRH11_01195 [Deltaproteobacteria bacterium]|nr:hypothetical protein [Deltaproteobacteria bacterium]